MCDGESPSLRSLRSLRLIDFGRNRRDAELGDECLESAQAVAEEPELGAKVNDSVWKMPLDRFDGARVCLFYTFDEENVHLLDIGRFDSRGNAV